MSATKVLFFGTHPNQCNGYSKVVYEIAKQFVKHDDIQLTIYGFQCISTNNKHRSDFPYDKVSVYDAIAKENPKGLGFGFNEVIAYVKELQPDVCIIFNDIMIISNFLVRLRESGIATKIIVYLDQVYLCQRKAYIDIVNKMADHVLAYTPYWETIMLEQGINLPTGYLQHGFNPDTYFPIPKHIARQYFNVNMNDFVVLNLNRNQPRKRWDTCLKAFAQVVSMYPTEPIKLVIGTALQECWDFMEIYERELKKRGMPIEVGMQHIVVVNYSQALTDEETNILYNIADIGINTCDGEGFGLCNFEQAAIGIPQIVPEIGGFRDFFNQDNALLCKPSHAYYVDFSRDTVGGEATMCDYMDFANHIVTYFKNPSLRKQHGDAARKAILENPNYKWDNIVDKLVNVIHKVHPKSIVEQIEVVLPSPVAEHVHIDEIQEIISEQTGTTKKMKKNKQLDEIQKIKLQLEKLLDQINSEDESDDTE